MATADSVKAKIQNLISRSNAATGAADKTLSAAVTRLIGGFGSGSGSAPTGTINITANGTHDVAAYASAKVNVPIPEEITVIRNVTISSDLGNGTNSTHTLLSADSFAKAHYSEVGFYAMLIPLSPAASAANVTHFVYHGNRNITGSDLARYGVALYNTSATAVGFMQATAKLNGTGWNVSLRADSSGNIILYVASSRIVRAGNYLVVLGVAD